MNYAYRTDSVYIFGKYLAIINHYKNGCIEIDIDEKGIFYKNRFFLYSLKNALKKTRKDIKYLERIKD